MAAWFLFYVASAPVRFRVAIGIELDVTKPTAECYVMGIFNSAVGFNVFSRNTTKGATKPKESPHNAQVPLPAHGTYFWVGFSFPQDNLCFFYHNEQFLGYRQGFLKTSNVDQMALPKDGNDCRLMEMHFICPAGTERNFFPIGKWLCLPPATSFSSGGNVQLTGEFELTDSNDDKIAFSFDDGRKGVEHSWNDTTPGTHHATFSVQGHGLMDLHDGGQWSRSGWLTDGWKAVKIKVERNFRVHKMEVSTGANIWKAA